jgi:hypothetical protein
MFGDPTFTNNSTYNHGTYNNTGNGIFYREDTDKCQEWLGSRVRSYCDAGDPFCDVGPYVDVSIHTEYLGNYAEEVVDFVVSQFENGGRRDDGETWGSEGSQEGGDGENKPGESAASGSFHVTVLGLGGLLLTAAMI